MRVDRILFTAVRYLDSRYPGLIREYYAMGKEVGRFIATSNAPGGEVVMPAPPETMPPHLIPRMMQVFVCGIRRELAKRGRRAEAIFARPPSSSLH